MGPGCGIVVAGYELETKVRGATQAQMHCQQIHSSNLGFLPDDTYGDNKWGPSCQGRLRQICHVERAGRREWPIDSEDDLNKTV